MAIALDSANNGGQISNTVLSWDHTCGAGATLLVVCIGVVDSTLADRTISGVTYNGDALTDSGIDKDNPIDGFRTEIWYRINPDTGGAYTITVTAGGKCTDIAGCSLSLTGTDTTDPIGSSGTKSELTGANPFITLTGTLATSWLVGSLVTDDSVGTAIAPTAPCVEIGEQDVGADVFSGTYNVLSSAGDNTLNWTDANSFNYTISAIEILAAAGGFNSKIMVDGAWKAVSSASVMVDGAWKAVNSMKVMVDGAWKAV